MSNENNVVENEHMHSKRLLINCTVFGTQKVINEVW